MKRSVRASLSELRTCHNVGKLLQGYLDGEIDSSARRHVERHLETCLKCGLDVQTYARVKRALAHDERSGPETTDDAVALQRLRRLARDLTQSDGLRSDSN